MVAQKGCMDFQDIVDGRRILLAKLAQGLVGEENAYLLGTLIVSKLHQAAMARQASAASERPPFFLYVDEFQDFITPSMAAILSGARKYGFGLILAHQELRQLWERDKEVASSVISNPGTRLCFRLGDFDAKRLEDGLSFFRAPDLQNLGIGEAIARVERLEWDFNLKVSPAPPVAPEVAHQRQGEIVRLCRARYARPRQEVEAETARKGTPAAEAMPARPAQAQPEPPRARRPEPVRDVEARAAAETPPAAEPVESKAREAAKRERPIPGQPAAEGKGGSEHRRLQALIKNIAESCGFRAVIEEPTHDGAGSVDVGLTGHGKRIACEVPVTSTPEQELGNIQKRLAAGYDPVVVCSPEKRTLGQVKALVSGRLEETEQRKVMFFQPEELLAHLQKEAAGAAGTEGMVKGYRVKVQYQPVSPGEISDKRKSVAQAVMQSLRRTKGAN
jgi:hypothetical protein